MNWRLSTLYERPLLSALILHAIFFLFFLINLEGGAQQPVRVATQSAPEKPQVQAVAVDEKSVQREIKKIAAERRAKAQALRRKEQRLKRLALAAKRAKKQRRAEEKRLQAMRREQKKVAAAKKKAVAEAQKKLETLAQQQAKLKEKAFKEKQAQAVASKINAGVLSRFRGLIQQTISQHWIIPQGVNRKLSCRVWVRLAPNGAVQSVRLIQSSGSPALDRSAITAIRSASPLPVPHDPMLFNQFRELRLTVRPEGYLASR